MSSVQAKLGAKSVAIAYALFVVGAFGALPIHWLYLGKVPVARFLTLNWFWIGALMDFLKLPQYVDEYNRGVR